MAATAAHAAVEAVNAFIGSRYSVRKLQSARGRRYTVRCIALVRQRSGSSSSDRSDSAAAIGTQTVSAANCGIVEAIVVTR